ncbi:hypothetical protein [Modestobacter altitudinis]|uniref:hypothetical protein n=1 Tax=Modestobacter altitudinis TaxID=2213158 RepID=UPI00110D004F|nr:hypothetical protein [Modestobacter altitudinis]
MALAISDAAAETGHMTHLIEAVHPFSSGLVAAASTELGCDAAEVWRRGRRGQVTIDRRATDAAVDDWPLPPMGERLGVTVVDLGLADGDPAEGYTCTVVVCRPTVPGTRLTEHLLDSLTQQPLAIAAIGPAKWPGEVTAGLGPRLRALRSAGRVIPMPMDRRLAITGLTASPLPKAVRASGHSLLQLAAGPTAPGAPAALAGPLSTRGSAS